MVWNTLCKSGVYAARSAHGVPAAGEHPDTSTQSQEAGPHWLLVVSLSGEWTGGFDVSAVAAKLQTWLETVFILRVDS